MANAETQIISINKTSWTKIADATKQILATPEAKPNEYTVFYRFSQTLPPAGEIFPSHRYIQNEFAEGFITGSTDTANCYSRLSPISSFDSVNLSVTVMGG